MDKVLRPMGTLLSLLVLAMLWAACTPRPPLEPPTKRARARAPGRPLAPLRVALAVDVSSLEVGLEGDGILRGEEEERSVGGGAMEARLDEGGSLLLSGAWGEMRAPGPVHIVPAEGGAFQLGGRRYGGTLTLLSGDHGLVAVNSVGMEEYLRGVVPWEIGWLPEEKIEALKAQAVAARTYALTRFALDGEAWDLVATESDQVYRGLERVDDVVDRAIRETAGLVLVYRGELVRTYYSSTCGGRTASLTDVWFHREGAPYLRGVADGPGGSTSPSRAYCRESPHFRWSEVWEGEAAITDILQALAGEQGVAVERLGRLKDVRIDEEGRSGRVRSTLFETEGAEIRVPGDRVRWVLRRPGGKGILRSTWFDLDVKRQNGVVTRIEADGHGHGHGIGLCQWGAMGMAAEGRRFDEILRHYYPGTRLSQADSGLLAETSSAGKP